MVSLQINSTLEPIVHYTSKFTYLNAHNAIAGVVVVTPEHDIDLRRASRELLVAGPPQVTQCKHQIAALQERRIEPNLLGIITV